MKTITICGHDITLGKVTVGMAVAVARAINATPDGFTAKFDISAFTTEQIDAYVDAFAAVCGLPRATVESMELNVLLDAIPEFLTVAMPYLAQVMDEKLTPAATRLQAALPKAE